MTTDATPSSDQNDDQGYQAAAESVDQYMRSPLKKPKHKKSNNLLHSRNLIIIGGLVVVIIIASGGYWLVKHHTKDNKPASSSSSSSQPEPQSSSASQSTTQHYVSNGQDLNLAFNYPSNWSITPASNNNSKDQTITLNSPSTTIQSADGNSVTGKITILIRPGTATINELNSNNPVVAQNSVQFAYSQPTQAQLQYPYLTFIHYATGSKVAGAFEEVIITGNQQFTQAQPINSADLADLDPIISASFYRCATTACAGQGDGVLSINNSTWTNVAIFSKAQALFTSLQLN